MSIPESQLETWSHRGSVTQSAATYAAIRRAIEAPSTPYAGKCVSVFLQGSYGNDTNVYADSDVDIVCVLHDCIHSDLSNLSEAERASYGATFSPATYTFIDLKRDVLDVLRGHFGGGIVSGGKAIPIPASGSRRKADLLAAVEFRRYFRFAGLHDQSYEEGLCFFDASGQRIENFPRQHSRNLTAKHQATMQWFKPTVRVIKNLRRCLVERGMIADGVAPSYYLEGLLYNAPNECFGRSYQDTIMHVLDWIIAADRSRFVCANQLYYLLWEGSPVAWRAARCDEFLQAASELWRNW